MKTIIIYIVVFLTFVMGINLVKESFGPDTTILVTTSIVVLGLWFYSYYAEKFLEWVSKKRVDPVKILVVAYAILIGLNVFIFYLYTT